MKLISMSVWGNRLMYWEGALANAQLHQWLYPGWKLRIYTDGENPITQKMRDYGCEIRIVENRGRYHGAFWRFFPVGESGIDAVIIRDADSRLNSREAAAVAAWLKSGKAAHVMRDHPYHYSWPMLGGMWGVRGGVIPDIEQKIAAWGKWGQKFDDQYFLRDVIWPLIGNSCVQHVSGYSRWGGESFPAHEPCDSDYVGQRYCDGGIKDSAVGSARRTERELGLLLACAKACHTRDGDAAIRQVVADGIDWTLFSRAAVDHDLVLVAAYNLARVAADLLPADILDAFSIVQEDARRKNRASSDELAEIIESLEQSGVEAIPLNGPIAEFRAYGNPGFDIVREVELLIRVSDLAPATAALRGVGFDRKGQETQFRNGGKFPVALCTRLTTEETAVNIDYAGLWERALRADLFGRTILTLAPEDALLALAVHGGQQMWRRIKQGCDLAAFIASHPQLDWAAIVGRARAQGCLRMLLLATSLARSCFGATVPDVITAVEREHPVVKHIAERIVARWEHAELAAPPDSTIISMDRLRMRDGVVRQVRYAAQALFSPTATRKARDFLRSLLLQAYANLLTQAARIYDRLLGARLALAVMPGSAKAKVRMRIRRRARADAERALARDPGNAEAWCKLGDVLSELARYAEAVACYDKALALAPSARIGKKRTAVMEAITRMGSRSA